MLCLHLPFSALPPLPSPCGPQPPLFFPWPLCSVILTPVEDWWPPNHSGHHHHLYDDWPAAAGRVTLQEEARPALSQLSCGKHLP